MKPLIEKVDNHTGFNWRVAEYQCKSDVGDFMCPWHYHVEYEVVIYKGMTDGQEVTCFVGDFIHNGSWQDSTMMMYGPGLPHMVSGRYHAKKREDHRSIVLWFTPSWIDSLIEVAPELRALKNVLRRSSRGIKFSKENAEIAFSLLHQTESKPKHRQLIDLMQVFQLMIEDNTAHELSSTPYSITQYNEKESDNGKVEAARQFIEDNFHRNVKISDFCQALHMSESTAYRLFERHFCESFSEHLKSFRIGKACELLISSKAPIALVAEQSGFNNLSNFNRQFRDKKGMTPSDFRHRFNM
ncbi:AraC family transcriptional regulator [Vibrio sonorensis]|uniref:AraC family transcriptional regulator n=1 Tax=Vibrio sonorensis TaxID=1004316 RepID=UPI0008D91146|nr:AraC family transcriptional regulator [Vibrio sonorensis]